MDPNSNPVTTPEQPAAPAPAGGGSDAQQGWMNTAPGGAQPAEPAQPQTETNNLSGATIPKQATENLQGLPVTSLKRGGLLGVVDSIADVLAGKQRPELGKDADGNLYVKQHDLTRGEQWMKIAGEAIHGAAAGLAAGKGAGNMGKAPLAGIEAGEQDQAKQKQNAQEMSDQVDKQKLANANNQMLQMKIAENAWTMANNKTKATQDDIKFVNDQEDRLVKDGGKVIGTAAHPGDIAEILKVQPDVFEQMIKKQTVRILPNIDADGNHAGVKAIIMPTGYHNELLPAGAQGHLFNPVSGQIETFNYSDPVTAGERDVHDAAAMTAKQDWDAKQRKAEQEAADLKNVQSETSAREEELPGKMAETAANTRKVNAEAQAAREKNGDANDPSLVDAIGKGQLPAGRLSYLLARNPALVAAVTKAYPGFDGSKVEAYTRAYADFTSGHTSQELLSGGTALEHLKELDALNTNASHVYGTPAYTAYQNKADTVATELARFYGDSTIPAIASIKKTLTTTLPGSRKAAISTQAGSMADRLDNYAQKWSNAAPSEAYEAQMPGISPKAKEAWAALDPKYAQRTAATIFTKQAPKPAAAAAPPGATNEVHQGGPTGPLIGHIVNGQYVPLQTGGR